MKITVEQFITKQERFYNRELTPFNKFLLREFTEYLKKQKPVVEIKKVEPQIIIPINKPKDGRTRIALITEDVGHLTGGRYYCWFIASALMELGYDVIVYTNRAPVFGGEFEKYKQPDIQVVAEKANDLENIDVQADIYIGSPVSGNVAAAKLGKKYNKPSYDLIFDPFPMMAQYLGKHTYMGWVNLINILKASETNIICLCNETAKYIGEWLNKRKEQILPIYPCINSRSMELIKEDKGDYVVFISRLVRHKNFDHVLKACKTLGIRLKVIASVDGINAEDLVKRMRMKDQVDFHFKVGDTEKFNIIYNSRAVISASGFEGFGMWAIEAVACGVPLVCYEYPTLREIEKFAGVDNFYFARYGSKTGLKERLDQALKENKRREPSHLFDFEALVKSTSKIFTIEPKIGVITIALNEEEFIGASLSSVIKHPNIKKVVVIEGAVNLYAHASTTEGLSLDKTRKKVFSVMQKKNGEKIIYEQYGWALDKSELRNRALQLLGKDITHVLVVDADEVWKQEDLDKLVQSMKENPTNGVFLFNFYHFWKQKTLRAVGGQWDSQMFRCFKFTDKKLHWNKHELPVIDNAGKFLNVTDGKIELPNVYVYHYSYLKKAKNIQDKLEYYKKRDTYLTVKDTWTNWKQGQPTQPTHGGGTIELFKGKHPEEVKGII